MNAKDLEVLGENPTQFCAICPCDAVELCQMQLIHGWRHAFKNKNGFEPEPFKKFGGENK